MKKILGLMFVLGVLTASPVFAAAGDNCAADFGGSCVTREQCSSQSTKADIGPSDCEDPKTCCIPKPTCTSKGGACDPSGACSADKKSVGVTDCTGVGVCCVRNVTCSSKSGTCKAACSTKETKAAADDCTGSKKYCCVPPTAPSGPAPAARKACSLLGGGNCVPKVPGCSAGYDDKASDTTDCDTFNESCCVKGQSTQTTSVCTCNGTVRAGLILPNTTFDSYCSQVSSFCTSCGGGTATCSGSFAVTKQECDSIKSDPGKIAQKYGVPSAALAFVNINVVSCRFEQGRASPVPFASATAGVAAVKPDGSQKTVGLYGLRNPLGARSVSQLIGQLVAWLGAIGGSLFFGYLIWGGVEWMTAAGSNERVESGRKKIVAAISGIVVILLAYMIVESLIGVISFTT